MIRSNLSILLIMAALGWLIAGLVEAAGPLAPPQAPRGEKVEARAQLWYGVDENRVKPVSPLVPRVPAAKPSSIAWPDGAHDVTLMVKFRDDLQVRQNSDGRLMSRTGRDVGSVQSLLDQLGLKVEPTYQVDPAKLQAIINRAELASGKQQPDLPGTFTVRGDRGTLEAVAGVFLANPLIEWASYKRIAVDPREAVAARKQQMIDEVVREFRDAGDEDQNASTTFMAARPPAADVRFDATGLDADHEGRPGLDPDTEFRPGGCNVPSCGACCLSEDDVIESPVMIANQPDYIAQGWPGSNPAVINVCDWQNTNSTICADLNGIFLGSGTQCEDSTQTLKAQPFVNCNTVQGWPGPTGACCTAGDCDVVLQSECLASGGIWLTNELSRFDPGSTPGIGIPPAAPPAYNLGFNPSLAASLYGMTNFLVTDAFGFVDVNNSNTSFSYYSGIPQAVPVGPGIDVFPGQILVRSVPGVGSAILNEPSTNQGLYDAADLAAVGTFNVIRRGLVDYGQTAVGVPGTPAFTNGVGGPNAVSGGFTFGSQLDPASDAVIYNPNIFLACTDESCAFGPCAVSCWDPANCTETAASPTSNDPNSPIFSPGLDVPSGNVLCNNFIYEQTCEQFAGRSSIDPDFNCSGSLFQDLVTGLPQLPQMTGCQVENNPDGLFDCPGTWSWFTEFLDPAADIFCGSDALELYEPEEGPDILRGTCFYNHLTYPTMVINLPGSLQIQGVGGCYGTQSDLNGVIFAECNNGDISGEVCAIAPICCDFESTYQDQYIGWSFLCADLANQTQDSPDLLSPYYTDFNQGLKPGGPYPEYNALGVEPVVARNINGQPILNGAGNPVVIGTPTKCQVNYGPQNQCWTAFFSPYQPSLSGEVDFAVNGPGGPTGGCADFECCHRICSIVELDPVTGFDYSRCCTVAWTNECVEKAQQICYLQANGVLYDETPNFTPLQFHLSQKTARGISQIPVPLRRLATAPMLPPSVISPLPGDATIQPDNWIQSIHQLQWTANPLLNTNPDLALATSVAALTASRVGVTLGPTGTDVVPAVTQLPPAGFAQFYYGDPVAAPIAWWQGTGLSLYGNLPGQGGWGVDPTFLSPAFGLYSWGQFLAQLSPGLHPFGPFINGSAGAGIRIAVIDTAAWVQEYLDFQGRPQGAIHEDLGNVLVEGPDLGQAPVKMLFDPFVTNPGRGTAVLGAIGAGANSYGVTGVAPQSSLLFFPTISADTGLRDLDAWVNAIESLGFGDVIVATYPAANGSECLNLDPEIQGLISVASDNGITVVIPVGDRASNIQAQLEGVTDTGAVIVGGSLPSRIPRRFWTSNFTTNPNGTFNPLLPVVSCMAPITTTGGDCNLTMMALNTEPDVPGEPFGFISRDMAARSYTNDFGNRFDGSKAAAAQVAGLVACYQGLSLQRYGIPQTPAQIRRLMWKTARVRNLSPTGVTDGGASPDPDEQFGNTGSPYFGFDLTNVEEEAPQVGGFANPANAGVAMVIDPEFALNSSEYLYDFKFIRGFQQFGSVFSLEEDDQNYLSALSQPTGAGSYNPPFFVPGSPVRYLSTGDYTDLYITGTDPADKEILGNRFVSVDALWPDASITEGYMYSFLAEKWQFLPANGGGVYFGTGVEETVGFEIVFPQQFFSDAGFFYLRFVTHTGPSGAPGSGGPGGQLPGFLIKYDFVDFGPSGPQGGLGG